MKKKFKIIAMLFALVLMMGACSEVQKDYLKETEKIAKWEYSEGNYDAKINMAFKVEDESINTDISQKIAAFTINNPKNIKGEAKMDMEIVVKGAPEEIKESYKDIRLVIDNDKIYMPLSLFEEMLDGKKFPEDKKYLLLDGNVTGMSEFNTQLMQIEYMKDPQKMVEVYSKLGELLDIEINTVKKEGKYITVIDKKDLFNITDKMVEKFATNSKEILEILQVDKFMGQMPNVPAEATEKMKKGISKEEAETLKSMYSMMKPELEKALKDFKMEITESFAKDTYKADISFKIDTEPFKFNMKMTGGQKKAEKREIKVPEAKEVMTDEEFQGYLPKPKNLIINFEEKKIYHGTSITDIKIIEKNGKTYYEARPIIESFEGKVGWDANKKTVTVDIKDKHYEVKLLNEGGVSFIDSEGLKSIGMENEKFPDQEDLVVTLD